MVGCMICSIERRDLTKHIIKIHKISVSEYKSRYVNSRTMEESIAMARGSSINKFNESNPVPWNKGKTWSKEIIDKISLARQGQIYAERFKRSCEHCCKEFEYMKKQARQKFCSYECSYKSRRRKGPKLAESNPEEFSRRVSIGQKTAWENPSKERIEGILKGRVTKIRNMSKDKFLKRRTKEELQIQIILYQIGINDKFELQANINDIMVVDFYSKELNKVIWVDGHHHTKKNLIQHQRDLLQENHLKQRKIDFLRLEVKEMWKMTDDALINKIKHFIDRQD